MADPEEIVKTLERTLKQVNSNLKMILSTIEGDPLIDAEMKRILKETEILSRWKRTLLPDGPREWSPRGFEYAVARAKTKAQEQGEPFVIAEKKDGTTVLVVSKSRLLHEKPFGLTEKDIIFETDKAMA